MHVHALAWIVLAGIILSMIVVDIVGHVRTPHEPTLKEATWWTARHEARPLTSAPPRLPVGVRRPRPRR